MNEEQSLDVVWYDFVQDGNGNHNVQGCILGQRQDSEHNVEKIPPIYHKTVMVGTSKIPCEISTLSSENRMRATDAFSTADYDWCPAVDDLMWHSMSQH